MTEKITLNYNSRKERCLFAMKQSKIRQRQIAEELDISQSTVAQMFSRPNDIDSIRYIEAIAKLTKYPIVWLMFGNYEMIWSDLNKGINQLSQMKPKKV